MILGALGFYLTSERGRKAMKGRSHRIPSSDPPDDWGDGSWTVDCICGVTFDDGEEMVNCDECGVWVHTRCSRFVKGETSFACDKCKSKKYRNNDSEETEVAQLLVELPTKTVRIEPQNPRAVPHRSPFRFWTDIPMEERVHVQGVPGDPAIFQGLSSVFTSELWKCTGYVPKKFNFQYKEFPCWEESENPVDRGAGVLFSLSKEIISYPAVDYERKLPPKEVKKPDGGNGKVSSGDMQNQTKKERNNLREGAAVLGKRKKEETSTLKDRNSRKKAMSTGKEAEKKKGATSASDYVKLELKRDRGFKDVNVDAQYAKSEEKECIKSEEKECILPKSLVDGRMEELNDSDKHKNSSSFYVSAEAGSPEFSPPTTALENNTKIQNAGQEHSSAAKSSPETDASVPYHAEIVDGTISVKKEEDVKPLNHLDHQKEKMQHLNTGSSSDAVVSIPASGDVGTSTLGLRDKCIPSHGSDTVSPDSVQTDIKVKREQELQGADVPEVLSSPTERKHSPKYSEKQSMGQVFENARNGDQKSEPAKVTEKKSIMSMPSRHVDPDQSEQGSHESIRQLAVPEALLESRQSMKEIDDPSKLGGTNGSLLFSNSRKLIPGVSKSSLTSCSSVLFKDNHKAPVPSSSDNHKPHIPPNSAATVKLFPSSKQRIKADMIDHRKEHSRVDGSRNDNPKIASSLGLKQSCATRIPQSTVTSSKLALSDTKEQGLYSSCRNVTSEGASLLGSVETDYISQNQSSFSVENKPTASSSSQKSQKVYQSINHSTTKQYQDTQSVHSTAPSTISATLSDEELALLLHQELNSSPRVPRVPRMRQAGGIAQLASPTATGLHVRRPSGFGGKDQIMFSRRKNKEETYKEGCRHSREPTDEPKKMDRMMLSAERKQLDHDAEGSVDKRETSIESPETVASSKRSMLLSSTVSNTCPSSSFETNERNLSSTLASSRDASDDDVAATAIAGPSFRTLPGLIDEIMSKGKRVTYEELCNAVLPHWHNLRKHNGERYAYASHSQAVLDCLRNRNEWSHLIDRGPKTNSGRKRRKLDADSLLDSDEDNKEESLKDVEEKSVKSHREDFPKGKRKARKRRRLALQGRGVKDIRKKQKMEATAEDELEEFSHSSEGTECYLSEDDSQGGGRTRGVVESDASASSAE
ncbi:hypothetical protein H6P81_006019 [Aristolochia fimbriata]|uniref:Zinc finger PHD-type domain-containing protein n=1 Tax=Aristolochia fimbriata TaxID=158543 RepID=A0AAV7EYB8_ARIFI|nr:hypothetical protein H6P81_006019 [Aristolochia fimbriata]